MNKKRRREREWTHALFSRTHLFKKYWFIEALVILIIWIIFIALAFNKKGGTWGDKLSLLSLHFPVFKKDLSSTWNIFILLIYLIFIAFAIFINVYKRFRVCNSLSCYLGEGDEELFKKEKKILNMATAVSTSGIVLAVPIIYFLSFFFRILFLMFIRKEYKSQKI